jgi:hypothetical protein
MCLIGLDVAIELHKTSYGNCFVVACLSVGMRNIEHALHQPNYIYVCTGGAFRTPTRVAGSLHKETKVALQFAIGIAITGFRR